MTMVRGFMLFHTLFLGFAWACCAKVVPNFDDVTNIIDHGLNHHFTFRAFGSHEIKIPNTGGSVSLMGDVQRPSKALGIAPVGLETPMSTEDEASSLGLEINKSSIVSLGLETPKIKGGIAFHNDHEINLSKDHKISSFGLEIRKSSGVSLGLETPKIKGNVVVSIGHGINLSKDKKPSSSFDFEIKKKSGMSLGLETPKIKGGAVVSNGHVINLKSNDNIAFSHRGKISLKSKGNAVSNGGKLGLNSSGSVVVSYSHKINMKNDSH